MTTTKHVAYRERLRNGSDRAVYCGDWQGGSMEICNDCVPKYMESYPQGWHYYPGDLCPHGTYTGGSGVDWMCGPCEMGE